MSYTGTYFGIDYVDHVYEPTESCTKKLIKDFGFKYSTGDYVRCRKKHRKSTEGLIFKKAYTSAGSFGGQIGGGTCKAYLINRKWYYESEIKSIID